MPFSISAPLDVLQELPLIGRLYTYCMGIAAYRQIERYSSRDPRGDIRGANMINHPSCALKVDICIESKVRVTVHESIVRLHYVANRLAYVVEAFEQVWHCHANHAPLA